jgi:hypothetical protein
VAYVYSDVLEMRVLEGRMGERQSCFEVKSTDARRDLPVEGLLQYVMIQQFDEVVLNIPVAPGCMASILDVGAVRHLMSVGVVGKDEKVVR